MKTERGTLIGHCDCGKELRTITIVEGKARTSGHRKICYDCVPLKKPKVFNKDLFRYCPGCDQIRDKIDFNPNKGFSTYCRPCARVNKRVYSASRKQAAVDYKGGKCERCGYKKSLRALDFHHKNPAQKDFNIQERRSSSLESIKSELDKCLLLCKNCHYEEHERLDFEKWELERTE